MKSEKAKITDRLNILKKYGIAVYTMNFRSRTPKGSTGLPDHFIIGKQYIDFIEVKIGKDKPNSKQTQFEEMIKRFGKCTRHITIHSEQEAKQYADNLISNNKKEQ